MSDDFCLLHGYEFMVGRFNTIPYCGECDRLKALGVDPVMHWLDNEGDPDRTKIAHIGVDNSGSD
jgi:hypothetical protein